MTDAAPHAPTGAPPSPSSWLRMAGVASLGAGAIHAAAIGVHAESRPAAVAFTVLATFQLGWGLLALVQGGRVVSLLGVAGGVAALAGWAVAKTAGISFIDGLDVAEPVQTADALAAALALTSLLAIGLSLGWARLRVPSLNLSALLVGALTVPGLLAAGQHVHEHGTEAGHDEVELATGADDGHAHGEEADATTAATGAASASHHEAEPVPYDPAMPIDLGGVDGVTPAQQAAAENAVAVTLLRLPQWTDPATAEAAGFRSIGDGFTGVEHFVNQAFMDDDTIMDPDQPESLVYDTSGGGRRLVAAMYMLKRGTPLENAPDIGGDLMQWHTHENLCYTPQGTIGGLTDDDGNCPAGLTKPVPTPMIHVWIESHPCGPFAALEGVGGGRILETEERLCDHAHGA